MLKIKHSMLITTIILLISMFAFPICAVEKPTSLDQRLNMVEIVAPISSEQNGFSMNRVVFTLNSPAKLNSETVAVDLLLPDGWNLKPSVPTEDGEITHFPFYAAADIYLGDEYIGYIGLCAFDTSDAEDSDPTSIYNQIAIGNVVQWDTLIHYRSVKEDAQTCNAVTKIMYSPRLFEDDEERCNTGILAYDKNICKYIGIEIADGSMDRTVVSEDEASIIAESITISRLSSVNDKAVDKVNNPVTGNEVAVNVFISVCSVCVILLAKSRRCLHS